VRSEEERWEDRRPQLTAHSSTLNAPYLVPTVPKGASCSGRVVSDTETGRAQDARRPANFRIARQPDGNTMRRLHAGLPSMIVIPVSDGVLMALVSLKPAAL
jgi:hypothetical protein